MGKGYIIEFEGLDCSFKETNANKLKEIIQIELQKRNIQREVMVVSFPDYLSGSSFFVRQYLSGNYPQKKKVFTIDDMLRVSTFYFVDMFHKWIKDIKPQYDKGSIIILDRYLLSSVIYQGSLFIMKNNIPEEDIPEKIFQIKHWILNLAYGMYDLPKSDYKIYMKMDIDNIIELVTEKRERKEDKDIHEEDFDYLRNTYNVFLSWIENEYDSKERDFSVINLTDEQGFIKTRNEIEDSLLEVFNWIMKSDNKFNNLFRQYGGK